MRVSNSFTRMSNPAFGQIKWASGGKQTLSRILSPEEKVEFVKLYNDQAENKMTSIYLFGYSDHVQAVVWCKQTEKGSFERVTDYSSHFWRSPIATIKKACEKADKLEDEVARRPSTEEFDAIMNYDE